MSSYSTLYVTRSRALELYAKLQGPSDAEMERLFDEKIKSKLYNVCIVSDDSYHQIDNYTLEEYLKQSITDLWPS